MLQTLSQLGRIKDKQQESNTKIKHVIAIKFVDNKYIKSELHAFDGSSKYLYARDFSGRPGLFLTSTIPQLDIKQLSDDNTKFIKKKVLWFSHGKLVNNSDLLNTLSDYRQNELKEIFLELNDKGEQIAEDVINILTAKLPEQTYLTIMIDSQFVGEIQDYLEFFNKGVLSKKENTNEEQLVCGVCNKLQNIYPYAETPLPFFFSDKLHFFESADVSNVARGFPVCHECYIHLKNGIKFIDSRLNYQISSPKLSKMKKKKSDNTPDLKFWLMPALNNYELLERFKNDLGKNKGLYYLDSLKDLCRNLKSIQAHDIEERQDDTDAFLRFSALFYITDKQAYSLMRVLSFVPDIYPPQLRKLLDMKQQIDYRYPFQHIQNQQFFVGLPLLVEFFKDIRPQWQAQVLGVLTKMFTGQKIPVEEIIDNINLRIHETLRYYKDLQLICKITFDGLMLVEYLTALNNGNKPNVSEKAHILMVNVPTDEIRHTDRFIETHRSVLNTETKQGVFAAGVSVAFLFDVQENKWKKTAPFWDQVSRLDMNLPRVMNLLPKVKRLLGIYKERKHDTIINYLIAKHAIDPLESIPKDLISYLFTLGLSFGYLLVRKNLKDNGGEEVTE
jgi:CRISPR-associated protein Cas8b/Csh1 subtype I-B